jgi:hypothetical protein
MVLLTPKTAMAKHALACGDLPVNIRQCAKG